jgi:hypothetical protein
MTDILADYREWRAEQEDRIGTHGDRCHMWPRHERCMIHRLARALEAARLTAEERQAVERAADLIDNKTCGDSSTLRALLERTK